MHARQALRLDFPLWAIWRDPGDGLRKGERNGIPGKRSRAGLLRPSIQPLLCLSPGPAKDMQPTMKFVMDTSKYWFKPSITREQGKAKTVSQRTSDSIIMSGLVPCSRQTGPWVMGGKKQGGKQHPAEGWVTCWPR